MEVWIVGGRRFPEFIFDGEPRINTAKDRVPIARNDPPGRKRLLKIRGQRILIGNPLEPVADLLNIFKAFLIRQSMQRAGQPVQPRGTR